jgi:hypothetical protein
MLDPGSDTLPHVRSLAVFAVAFSIASGASAALAVTPHHYVFSFRVNLRPDYVNAFPSIHVNGRGAGSFSITHRQIDRDGTVFWNLTGARGSLSLSSHDHVFVRATVLGGTFGTEKVSGGLARSVLMHLRIASSTRFRCRKPAATLELQDLPSVKGNSDAIQFHACAADLQWTGKAPALVVRIAPA